MKNINWRKHYYHIKHNYLTFNNVSLAVAIFIALGWTWGSVSMMQRNYALQHKVDAKQRQLDLNQLEVQKLEYEQAYYKSEEYQKLAARHDLDLADLGEKLIILPENSQKAKNFDKNSRQLRAVTSTKPKKASNFEQWLRFLAGSNAKSLQK